MWNTMECDRDSFTFLGQHFDQLTMKFNKKTKTSRFDELVDLRACETLWSAREITSVVLSAEQERRTENVFHMLLNYNISFLVKFHH